MKASILKLCIALLSLYCNTTQSQVTIDYTTYSPNGCNIFGLGASVNGVAHQTTYGQPEYNTNNHSVKLVYNNTNGVKGTEYKIAYNFKQDYTYKITVWSRNATSLTVAAGLKVAIGDNGSASNCGGPELVTNIYGLKMLNLPLSSSIFQENGFNFNEPLSAASNYFRLSSYSEFQANPATQTIEIQKIIIEETPPSAKFTLSSSVSSVPCNTPTSITFTANNIYNSPGTLSYNWNVGSGWKLSGVPISGSFTTSANTITLTSDSFPIPDVSVIPIFNGVAQPQKTVTIGLAPFTNTTSITGNNAICPSTSAVYGISNLGSGSTISWSTSNTSIATVTPASGNQATVNPIASQGTFNLIAVITNACGQQKTLTKTLSIGQPMFQINYVPRDLFIDLTLSPDYGSAALYEQGVDINAISWNKISQEGGNVYFSGSGLYGTVLFPNSNSSITIEVSLTNNCGTTSYPLTLMPGYADSRIGNLQPSISKISNDLYEIINAPEDINKFKVSVYDIYGNEVFKTNTNQIDLSNLKAGVYIIKAQAKDRMLTLKIIKA